MTAPDALTPADAAAALAELRARREQVVVEHRPGPPEWWDLPLVSVLAFARLAVRDLAGRRHARTLRGGIVALEIGSMLIPRRRSRVWPAVLVDALETPEQERELAATVSATARESGCLPLLVFGCASGLVQRRLVGRVRRSGLRCPNTAAGLVAAALGIPLTLVSRRLVARTVHPDRFVPDVAAPPASEAAEPSPALEPLFAEPAALALAGLLGAAGRADTGFLCEATQVSEALLLDRLAPLERAGLVERRRSGRVRPRTRVTITDRGRAALAGHAAALRKRAAA